MRGKSGEANGQSVKRKRSDAGATWYGGKRLTRRQKRKLLGGGSAPTVHRGSAGGNRPKGGAPGPKECVGGGGNRDENKAVGGGEAGLPPTGWCRFKVEGKGWWFGKTAREVRKETGAKGKGKGHSRLTGDRFERGCGTIKRCRT